MWIVLSFTACLVSSPAQCEPRELAYSAESVTLMQCQVRGMAVLAEWTMKHPKWRIAGKHSCTMASAQEAKA